MGTREMPGKPDRKAGGYLQWTSISHLGAIVIVLSHFTLSPNLGRGEGGGHNEQDGDACWKF